MNLTMLAKYNQYLRRQRPLLDQSIICDVFRNNTFLEIAFISKCCRNDAKGSCIMCDYGAISGTKTQNIYLSEMERILNQNKGIKYLLQMAVLWMNINCQKVHLKQFCKGLEVLKYRI